MAQIKGSDGNKFGVLLGDAQKTPAFHRTLKDQSVITEYVELAMDKYNGKPGSYEALAELASFMSEPEIQEAKTAFLGKLRAQQGKA